MDYKILTTEYENFEKFWEKEKSNRKIIKWDFFHPFFNILIQERKICKISDGLIDNYKGDFISNLEIFGFRKKISQTEILTIFYCYIDEICGNFIYAIDPNFFLTTSIYLDFINNKEIDKSIQNLEVSEKIIFLCIVTLHEILKEGRKILLGFSLFRVDTLRNQIKFEKILSGSVKFQKPKLLLPMTITGKF